MRIALYGGSFDPPHVAHQMACLYVLSTYPIDQVWVIPCFQHAFGKKSVLFEHRYVMCQQAMSWLEPHVKISDIEATLQGPSYTLRTVKTLQAQHPEHTFSWVVGEDAAATLPSWHGYKELTSLIQFVILGREGMAGHRSLPLRLPQVSSTEIRDLLKQGVSPKGLVPSSVLSYIETHQLYQEPILVGEATQGL